MLESSCMHPSFAFRLIVNDPGMMVTPEELSKALEEQPMKSRDSIGKFDRANLITQAADEIPNSQPLRKSSFRGSQLYLLRVVMP